MASRSQTHFDVLKPNAIWIALGCSLLAAGAIFVPSVKPFWWMSHVFVWLLAACAAGFVVKAARTRAPNADHYRVAVLVALLPVWAAALLPVFGCVGAAIFGLLTQSSQSIGLWVFVIAGTLVMLTVAGLSIVSSWRDAWMLLIGPVAAVGVACFEKDEDRGMALICLVFLVAILMDRAWNLHRVLGIGEPGQCVSCGYNLTGVVAGVCPECGASTQRPELCRNCGADVTGLRSRTCARCGEPCR